MNRALGMHSWTALPQAPQECGGSYRSHVTPRSAPTASRVLVLRSRKHGVRSLIIQKLGKMMEGKMMEEKIRIPDNGSTIPVLHDFTLS
ncbi:MAG: hypothetical protein NTW21_40820 [Verrucomicrobia bacterium]|nr:hypothetical protein [Verrucomicrobiota bacterium]